MTGILLRALGGLAALFLAACGVEYPQSSIDPQTDFAETIHGLYVMVFWWTMGILAVVWGILGYVLVRFRARAEAPIPRQTHGHLGIEVAWTLGPTLIVIAITVPTINVLFDTQREDPEQALVVDVVGHQYWWEFRYADQGVVTANELHLPVGRPVTLRLSSEDVIHSFWVPKLGGKRDVNPLVRRIEGEAPRYSRLHFTVFEPGVYMGQCAEFCGASHSLMGLRVVAESEAEFQDWLADWQGPGPVDSAVTAPPDSAPQAAPEAPADTGAAAVTGTAAPADTSAAAASTLLQPGAQPTPPTDPVALGRETFLNSTCIACHAVQGTVAQGEVGPNLTLLGRRSTIASGWLENTPENLARWITSPSSVKPGVLMPGVAEAGGNWPATNLSAEQVTAVAAYLSSLR